MPKSVVVFLLLLTLIFVCDKTCADRKTQHEVENLVSNWSREIGEELHRLSLSMTRKKKVAESFSQLKNTIYQVDGDTLIEDIANRMRDMMDKKTEAVFKIAKYAEFLARHRNTDWIEINDTYPGAYQYYNADAIEETTAAREDIEDFQEEVRDAECDWWCDQKDFEDYITEKFYEYFATKTTDDLGGKECDCTGGSRGKVMPLEHYEFMPMTYDSRFGSPVNLDMSVVKVTTNVFHRDQKVLQGIRWSEALDMAFKDNLAKDPTLKYQYFASPYGYMRHFPERYDQTYDPRTRSWYTEAMTSPKDIIILLDRSGSMRGKRRQLSWQIVNNILDTLNDNDFVNIYTFTNTTEPLVECFEDILVQGNEENLRLLRESLSVYELEFAADISLGFNKAFEILENFRVNKSSADCNQAIMLITEGVDYDYKPEIFNYSNWQKNSPVRIFTYELGALESDAAILESIACQNRGYFVNVSVKPEIREKVLNYINVMSRPINLKMDEYKVPIWSYLQIDLADRRYSNWLWRKFEGNRQREVFLDHAKREFQRLGQVLTSPNHMLLKLSHDYEVYKEPHDYDYMTTVSLPVYGHRPEDIDLVGVAGVDVPIKLLNSFIPHHQLGVNGYAFILTNNGYILMHPGHRREFENIPKPTFNRVDLLEIEILDDSSEPRLFDKSIVELREKIVLREKGKVIFKVKEAIDQMKRILLSERRYYYTNVGPFSLGIALPNKYGLMIVNNTQLKRGYEKGLLETKNWKVHPDWIYCKDKANDIIPETDVLNCWKDPKRREDAPLFSSLLFDAFVTKWFEDRIENETQFVREHLVRTVFLATHSGLTRWRNFNKSNDVKDEGGESFENTYYRAIDEDWYKRAVDENYKKEDMFIYSVPFEISGFENNTMITSTTTIFVKDKQRKTPVAVVGLQFNHRAMFQLYKTITKKCGKEKMIDENYDYCEITCESDYLDCFILDNNAYVVLSDEIEYTGRYIGDIRPDIMYHLVEQRVYKPTRMFDYQAICPEPPPEPVKRDKPSCNTASTFHMIIKNLLEITNWALATIIFMAKTIMAGPDYESKKNETLAYEKLELNKTFPTPCDHEMWLFTLTNDFSSSVFHHNKTSKFECDWPYVVEKIPNSNLVFMAINHLCKRDTDNVYLKSPTPMKLDYNGTTLPCYIATKNKYNRRKYMKCYENDEREKNLNKMDKKYCGHDWKPLFNWDFST